VRIVLIGNIGMTVHPIHTAEQLATHLRALRRRLGLTQAELGVRLGVEQARVAKIERNPGSISVDQLLQLLTALEVRLLLETPDGPGRASTAKVEW
jgi:HTH-type transcriptional regulator/antitoxin HipB